MKSYFIIIYFLFISCLTEKVEKTDFPYNEITISELNKGYLSGEFTVHHIVSSYINRINEIDKNGPKLNSIIEINPDALKLLNNLMKNYLADM